MKSHDELMAMSETDLEAYRKAEVERVIQSADPHKQLYLRAMQARYLTSMKRFKNPMMRLMA